jgi:lipopolysaccharide/colanic/teichoic acid biosynthesis glycosyltransferase
VLPYVIAHPVDLFVIPLIYAFTLYVFDAHVEQRRTRGDLALWIITHAGANLLAWCMALMFVYLQGVDRLGRGIFGLFGLVHLIVSLGWRYLWERTATQLLPPARALIVGTGEPAVAVASLLRSTPGSGLAAVGFVDTGDGKPAEHASDLPVHSGVPALREVADATQAHRLILTQPYPRDAEWFRHLVRCRLDGFEVLEGVDLYEDLTGRVPLKYVDDYMALLLSLSRLRLVNSSVKRATDLLLGGVLLVAFLPVMGLVALLIKMFSPGPIFYLQERMGQHGRGFPMIKFRTMVVDAEAKSGPTMARENDPRITPLGRALRAWRLDELPQLINVLLGHMSLVGPRPEREVFVTDFSQRVPVFRPGRRKSDAAGAYVFDGWREAIHLYSTRLLMKPGLTGWAQVSYPYASTLDETRMQFEYDLYYIKHQSLLFDLAIILRTASVLVRPSGR